MPGEAGGWPLDGVKVLELCQVAAGPFCGMLLADMGADVVKVEPPGGDPMRAWPPITDGFSENFLSINRNKRSVVLDLKSDDGRARARALALAADVVVENYRTGTLAKFGLDAETLRAAKPALVYCSISAYGQTGPRAREGGFDVVVQARSGVMSVTGMPDGPAVKAGVPLSDFGTGLYAAYAIASALLRRDRTGAGAVVDVPMFGCSIAMSALQTSEYFGTGRAPHRRGAAHPRNAPYSAFPCKDGEFVVAAGNDRLWHAFCRAMGVAELTDDPRFASVTDRAANQDALAKALEPVFMALTRAEILARLDDAGVPASPINTYPEALADPQAEATGLVQAVSLPSGRETRTVGCPVAMTGRPAGIRAAAPALGADTEAVLADWLPGGEGAP